MKHKATNRIWELWEAKARREGRPISIRTAAHESGVRVSNLQRILNQQSATTAIYERLAEWLDVEFYELWEKQNEHEPQ